MKTYTSNPSVSPTVLVTVLLAVIAVSLGSSTNSRHAASTLEKSSILYNQSLLKAVQSPETRACFNACMLDPLHGAAPEPEYQINSQLYFSTLPKQPAHILTGMSGNSYNVLEWQLRCERSTDKLYDPLRPCVVDMFVDLVRRGYTDLVLDIETLKTQLETLYTNPLTGAPMVTAEERKRAEDEIRLIYYRKAKEAGVIVYGSQENPVRVSQYNQKTLKTVDLNPSVYIERYETYSDFYWRSAYLKPNQSVQNFLSYLDGFIAAVPEDGFLVLNTSPFIFTGGANNVPMPEEDFRAILSYIKNHPRIGDPSRGGASFWYGVAMSSRYSPADPAVVPLLQALHDFVLTMRDGVDGLI